RVQVLLGTVSSPIALAIAPVTAQSNIPFIVTGALAPDPSKSPTMARFSFSLGQVVPPLGTWAARKGWKKAYTVVIDYAVGRQVETAFNKAFTSAGGSLVGSGRFPFGTSDFFPFMQRAKNAKPDVLFVWTVADDKTKALMKAIKDIGLREAGINVVTSGDVVP